MRIISGSNKGRIIKTPANLPVRPTTDLAKESLFNILNNHFDFEELDVLDLFAGTGNISYEFASRGAKRIVSVDNNFKCAEFIRKAAQEYGFNKIIAVQRANVFVFLKYPQVPFDLIFADPPYDMEGIETIPDLIFNQKLLKPGGWLILEHSSANKFKDHPLLNQQRNYGRVNFSIFSLDDPAELKEQISDQPDYVSDTDFQQIED
ncbi:MAG: RsmD family RNA methyltransferase [Bacteroidetes bacterium]|nr:RsmD family RNA methyltransferase [Bacteroidota bacterium]